MSTISWMWWFLLVYICTSISTVRFLLICVMYVTHVKETHCCIRHSSICMAMLICTHFLHNIENCLIFTKTINIMHNNQYYVELLSIRYRYDLIKIARLKDYAQHLFRSFLMDGVSSRKFVLPTHFNAHWWKYVLRFLLTLQVISY